MAQYTHSIVLYHEIDVQLYETLFFEWLEAKIRLHFLLLTGKGIRCCDECIQAFYGQNPNIKVILIDPRVEDEINALVTVFYRENPSLRYAEEAAVGDRTCPFCGA